MPQAAAAGTHTVNLPIDVAANCKVYYNEKITGEDWSAEMHEVAQGQKITHTGLTWPYGISLFAAPDDGYALSALQAGGSNGDYYTISDGASDGTGCEFLSKYNNYSNLITKAGYTEEQIKQVVANAIACGCDGVMLFSRNVNDGDVSSNLKFYAEKLPTLEKKIVSVTPYGEGENRPYTAGMSVGLGDVINYSLDVTFYKLENTSFAIDYSDVNITDEKTGNTGDKKISVAAPTAAEQKTMTANRVVSTEVKYTITQSDVEQGTVINQAQLSYQYKSLHSKGQLATTSDAQAEITVHASVSYQYKSGTSNMELPAELAAMTPTDYTYHDVNSEVTV